MILKNIKFPSSGYKSPWLSYWMVAGLAILIFLSFSFIKGFGLIANDTLGYYSAGERIFNGVLDQARPPVYPIILHVFEVLFGFDGSRIAVSILQTIVFFVSIVYVNKSSRCMIPQHPRICFWVTMLYVIIHSFGKDTWTNCVLSDSFAISCSAFLTYCVVKSAQPNAPLRYAVWMAVWLLLLVFNRPVLLCYIPVVAFFWITLYLQRRQAVLKHCLAGLSGVVAVALLVGLYTYEIHQTYHLNSMSFISTVNNYFLARYGGLITPDDTDDAALKEILKEYTDRQADNIKVEDGWKEMKGFGNIPDPVLEEAVNHAIKSNPRATITTIIQRFFQNFGSHEVIYVNILMILAGGVLFMYYCRFKQFPLIPWTVFLLGASLLAAIYLGAMNGWKRLSAPMFPMFVLIVGWAFSKLRLLPPDTK